MHTIRHAVNICATSPLLIRVCRLMQFHQHLAHYPVHFAARRPFFLSL